MGKTIYKSCVELLESKKGKVIKLEELKALIIMHIGGQIGTINQALQIMGSTGLIKDIGNCRFKIQ